MSHNKKESKKTLNWARIKMGIIGVLCAGDEAAFSPFHTVIIKALGGADVALGIIGGIMQCVAQLFSWIGAIVLYITHHNRKAMVWSLAAGATVQGAIVMLLVSAGAFEKNSPELFSSKTGFYFLPLY